MIKRYKIILCFFLLLLITGCGDKKSEEALAVSQTITIPKAEMEFTLNGLWYVHKDDTEEKELEVDLNKFKVELEAYREEDGSSFLILTEDLSKTEGGELLRTKDYMESLMEGLKISKKYSYSCSEIDETVLYGKQFLTFRAEIKELGARQYYYVRRMEDEMILLIGTVYGESNIYDILDNGRKK